jgi:ribonuclease VapC
MGVFNDLAGRRSCADIHAVDEFFKLCPASNSSTRTAPAPACAFASANGRRNPNSLKGILRDEPEAPSHARTIADATVRRVSAVNFVESAVINDASRDPIATRRFDDFIREADISIAPITQTQAQVARSAYRDFGKGSGNPAKLNFGDCFAYALAKESGEPLLFKGGDFAHTDIVAGLPAKL